MPDAAERALVREIVREAARRYIENRSDWIDAFVDRHFTLLGSLALHRRVFGWDLLRAPVNLFLTTPALAVRLSSRMARRLGWERGSLWLGARHVLRETDLSREIEWLAAPELLELPYARKGRLSTCDALAEGILTDPRAPRRLAVPRTALGAADPELQRRLHAAIESCSGTRAAVAEITTGLMATGFDALTVKRATPGLITLGSVIATTIAQQSAIAAFPLGAGLGGIWCGWYPVAASPGLLAMTIGGALLASAAGFASGNQGSWPLPERRGSHQRLSASARKASAWMR